MKEIDIGEFGRLDIRVGRIVSAKRVEGSKRLIKMGIDIGGEVRQCIAGLADHYDPASLVGRDVVVLVNIKPRTIFGQESRVMLLAAVRDEDVSLIVPDRPMPSGTKVL